MEGLILYCFFSFFFHFCKVGDYYHVNWTYFCLIWSNNMNWYETYNQVYMQETRKEWMKWGQYIRIDLHVACWTHLSWKWILQNTCWMFSTRCLSQENWVNRLCIKWWNFLFKIKNHAKLLIQTNRRGWGGDFPV